MKLVWDFHELYDFGEKIGNFSEFDKHCKKATQELAKVLQEMLFANTPVKTGNLASCWGGAENYAYTVVQTNGGFEVTLRNTACNENGFMYGYAVNYGHYSYNQYGGAYGFVKGRFFVEKSVLQSEGQAEYIIYKELDKWFRWCLNGK